MLNYNEIKRGKIIVYKNEPHKVISSRFVKKNRNKATNNVSLKSLISNKNFDITFRSSDKVAEAEIEKKDLKFLYQKGKEVWFCNPEDLSERFFLNIAEIAEQIKYLKSNDLIRGKYFSGKIIGLDISPKVELKVKEAPEAVRGNTSSGATKKVILENGLEIFTPLFIEKGDYVIVSTETGEYCERKKK